MASPLINGGPEAFSTTPGRSRTRASRHGEAGFTLIEMGLVLAVTALALGVVIPASGAWLDATRQATTRQELDGLADACVRFFGDTGVLPASLPMLVENDPATPGWNGPYAGYSNWGEEAGFIDAWANSYSYVLVDAHTARIQSPGPDRILSSQQLQLGDDLQVQFNVHRILREETDEEIEEINEAIRSYNASLFLTDGPLPADYGALLLTLKNKGFLTDPTGRFDTDGWGQAYVTDGAPAQRVHSLGSP